MCVKSTDAVYSYTFCIGGPPQSEFKEKKTIKFYLYQRQLPGCGICAFCPRGLENYAVTRSYLGLTDLLRDDQGVCRWNVSFCSEISVDSRFRKLVKTLNHH